MVKSKNVAQNTFLFLIFIMGYFFCQAQSQKSITAADYKKWGALFQHTISDNGLWTTAYMSYEDSPDTLHIVQVNGKKAYKVANPREGHFWGATKYAVLDDTHTLCLLDLNTGIQEKIPDVQDFAVTNQHNYLITLHSKANQKEVCIRNDKGQLMECLKGITSFKMSPSSNAMVGIGNSEGVNQLHLIQLDKVITQTVIDKDSQCQFSNLKWSSSNRSFVYSKIKTDNSEVSVCFYNMSTKQKRQFDAASLNFPKAYLLNGANPNLSISPDDRRIFMSLQKNVAIDPSSKIVEVWGGADGMVYPKRKKIAAIEETIRYGVWWHETDTFRFITSDSKPFHLLNPTMDFAVTYNITDKEPQYVMKPNVDYYLKNLETGQEQLLVANQSSAEEILSFAPNGQYVAYFKDTKWYLYDMKNQKQLPLSNIASMNWNSLDYGKKSAFRLGGWGTANDCFFLNDEYDVWKVPFDGSTPIRLTRGREQKIIFRIHHFIKNNIAVFSGSVAVDLSNDIVFSASSENATGYFIRKPNGTFKPIVYNDYSNKAILKATKAPYYVYQSQHFSQPHALHSYHSKTTESKTVFQSNPHYVNYLWGKQEQIQYKNAKNETLKGTLYYPVAYDANKKYPMVVSIYEELNFLKHNYFNPTMYNSMGFNVTNLTTQGYFVLLPDIKYELGNPGLSATDCVVAATKEVLRKDVVLSDKIALVGHSFGGYETNFIVTQTNIFKTAISGASVYDLPSWYLSISNNSGDSEIWRFESQQWRMSKSLYEDRKGYERNSPSTWVENVTMPVLIWTGDKDPQINPNQSIAFYLALRRLNKKVVFLNYSNESHSLLKKESQVDLYYRFNDWLNYHLKDESPAEWIIKGLK